MSVLYICPSLMVHCRHGAGLGWAGIRPLFDRPIGVRVSLATTQPARGYCRIFPYPPKYPPRRQDFPNTVIMAWIGVELHVYL